jgi:hypothetical protein
MVNSVAMKCNNRAAVFSMRSVPATIGKLFILYRPMVNSVAKQQMDKHATMDSQQRNLSTCFLCGPITGYITRTRIGIS